MAKLKVLQVSCGGLGNGGVQAVIMQIVRNLKEEIDFDILLFTNAIRHYDDEFELYGKIFRLSCGEGKFKTLNKLSYYFRFFKIFCRVYGILKNEHYDVIHCHNYFESGICNLAAYFAGVKIRISHAHNSKPAYRENFYKRMYDSFLKILINKFSNVKIGCSSKANDYLFYQNNKDKQVILNAVELNKFLIKNDKKNDIKDSINFIHIGRYCFQKNQLFLLDVFKLINDKLENTNLTLIGFGDEEKKVKDKIQLLNLDNKVKMLPHNCDIVKELTLSDYMIFPSTFEGFGIVLLEAQCVGIPCIVSTQVPNESNIGLCKYLSLDKGAKYWADEIIKIIDEKDSAISKIDKKKLELFDIKEVIKKYKKIYYSNEG